MDASNELEIKNDLVLPNLTGDDLVDFLEKKVLEMPQVEQELIHRFYPQLYLRELKIPKGCFAVSKQHKTEHPYIVLEGCLEVVTNDKEKVVVSAGYVGRTPAGVRRAAFAHEDTRWLTIHVNIDNETDLDKIEAFVIEPHENKLISNDKKEELL